MKQIKKSLVFMLIAILGFSTMLLSQPKYHTVPKQMMQNINMNNTGSPLVTSFSTNSIPDFNLAINDNPAQLSNYSGQGAGTLRAEYPGFTPVFAHQVVNDKAGNLLFFIVDNYIYNKDGHGFSFNSEYYTVYGDPGNDYDPYADCTETTYRIHNDIIVVPVPGSCTEFYMFYALLHCETAASTVKYPKLYYKKITVVNENEIQMTNQVQLSTTGLQPACWNHSGFSMDITTYDSALGDYLLVAQWLGEYEVFEVGSTVNTTPIIIPLSKNAAYGNSFGSKRPDPVLIVDNETVFYINSSQDGLATNPDPSIKYLKMPRNFSLISASTWDKGYLITSDNVIGMESSPNKNYLYFTYENSSGIKYLNISDYIYEEGSFPSTIYSLSPTGSYSNTQIELFGDGKLYALNHNSSTNKGTYTSINTPNSPTSTSFTYNCFNSLEAVGTYIIDCGTGDDFKRYIFNHQIDNSDYYTNYPALCSDQPDWSTIGSNETWLPGVNNNPFDSETGIVYFDEDFEIPTGKYIQLSNMEFHFAASKRVIINTGATIRLVGSTFTSANQCDAAVTWTGVDVLGNSSLDQSTANQGRIRVDAGSEISNATKGIRVEGGAMCNVYGGDFINNRYGICFESYTHPTVPSLNMSSIINATFTTNDALNSGLTPVVLLYLHTVKGVGVSGCTFENTRPSNVSGSYRGYGVYTYRTDETIYNCDFDGLRYGVYTVYGTPKVKNCDFTNNFRGTYIGASINAEVTGNNFNGDITFAPASGDPYSTYIGGNGASNTLAKYEENSITGGTVGAYFYNMGPNAIEARDNVFTSITGASNACAAVAKGKNSDFVYSSSTQTGAIGLEFRCNSFSQNPYALSVIDGNMRKNQGAQGKLTSSLAGNGFDHFGTASARDFYVDPIITSTLDIPIYTYWNHADYFHKVMYVTSGKVQAVNSLSNFVATDCTAATSKGLPVGDGIGIIEDTDTEILLEEFELAELTDVGNTMALLSETETMSEASSVDVARNISELAGFISDEVAISYIQNNSGNEFAKAKALLENSPLPSTVQSELNNMEMNPALKSIIILEQAGTNSKEAKQGEIAELKQFRGLVVNEIVLSGMDSESTNEEKAALIQFLQNDNNLQSKFHLVDINCKMQEFAKAKANLETIQQMIQSEDMQYIAEMEDYIELQSIMIDIESGAIKLEDAVDNNLELISFIADNEDYSGELTAQLLLDEAGLREYEELIRLPEPAMDNENVLSENKQPSVIESYDDIINIYPNPTSDNIYVEYAFLNNNENHFIEILGINGNLIDKIELSQSVGLFTYSKKLAAGIYIIKVGGNYSQKITVQ